MSLSTYLFIGCAGLLGMLLLFVFIRMFFGPTAPDRLVALDTTNTMVVALMLVCSVISDSVVMVDVAIVYGALSFVSTIFFARYLEGGM
jgi:multicomponent Na+:H+ antiporter subunit F